MPGFKRSVTLSDMTMIAIGGRIGSGIFLTPATIARDVGTSLWFVAMILISKPAQAWAGLGFLGLGVPVYYFWKRTSTQERHER